MQAYSAGLANGLANFQANVPRHGSRRQSLAFPGRQRLAPKASSSTATGVDTWEAIRSVAGQDVLRGGFAVRPGDEPGTVSVPTLPTSLDSRTTKPVLFYRDTHGWCPFCER